MTTVAPTKTGSLTIAGSGIASVAQLTLETVSHIQQADKVFYIVCDPATEAFIQAKAKAPASDLAVYYDTDKSRYDSYVQMAEVCLSLPFFDATELTMDWSLAGHAPGGAGRQGRAGRGAHGVGEDAGLPYPGD